MRLYLDCEFNGFGGELLSMALVSDDGREWYCTLPEPKVWNEWVFENVLPVIMDPRPTGMAADRVAFQASLRWFLSQFDNPTIVADWYMDFIHFFQAFQGKDHTQSFAYACKTELVLLDEIASEVPHNALADARAIRDALAGRIAA
jgi:hypothetical protein